MEMRRVNLLLCLVVSAVTAVNAQLAETPPSSKPIIIGCLGDSITQGIGASAQVPACAQLPKFLNKFQSITATFTSINLGISGTTTADWRPGGSILHDAIAAMTAANVNVVQIMLGTNDAKVAVSTSPTGYSSNLQAIIVALMDAGFTTVILHEPIYISQAAGQWDLVTSNALIQQYGSAITTLALANAQHVFDGDHLGYEWFRVNTADSADGIHPNDNGHVSLGFLWAMAYSNLFLRNTRLMQVPRTHR
jgi:lysophospholipase L1-like esterase